MKQKFNVDNERMKECQKSGLKVVRPTTKEAKANGGGEAIPKDDDSNMIRLVSGKRVVASSPWINLSRRLRGTKDAAAEQYH